MTQEKCAKQKPGQSKRKSFHFQGNLCQRFHLLPRFIIPTYEIKNPQTQVSSFEMPLWQAKHQDGTLYNQTTSDDLKNL